MGSKQSKQSQRTNKRTTKSKNHQDKKNFQEEHMSKSKTDKEKQQWKEKLYQALKDSLTFTDERDLMAELEKTHPTKNNSDLTKDSKKYFNITGDPEQSFKQDWRDVGNDTANALGSLHRAIVSINIFNMYSAKFVGDVTLATLMSPFKLASWAHKVSKEVEAELDAQAKAS